MASLHCADCRYRQVAPGNPNPHQRQPSRNFICANGGHGLATRLCLCSPHPPLLCDQCYQATHQTHTWVCICVPDIADESRLYQRRNTICRVREVVEMLERQANDDYTAAQAAIHLTLEKVVQTLHSEAEKLQIKLETYKERLRSLVNSLLSLQFDDNSCEDLMYKELCFKPKVFLKPEMFTCLQTAVECKDADLERTVKGWWRQMVNIRMEVPVSLDEEGKQRSFCVGCLRQPSTLGALFFRKYPLPCGHFFHNKECLFDYLVRTSRGFYYTSQSYRCPECWLPLDFRRLLEMLDVDWFNTKAAKYVKKCCSCGSTGELFKRKQPGHYLCEVCAEKGGLVDCRPCQCESSSIYLEARSSSMIE